jgi:hypothetical protein
MPVSEIQSKVLRCVAANRSPENYLAGATVLHRNDDTPRFSQDLDFFNDVADSVAQSAEADANSLVAAGYALVWQVRMPTFQRAIVTSGDSQLRVEWAQDSAFRFFPVVEDEECGYRLHEADAAVNKLLALAGRDEIRDFVDVLHLHDTYLSVGALAWAACGKDPGFTPQMVLEQAGRHCAYTQSDIDRLDLRVPLDLRELKSRWLAAVDDANRLTASLPPEELGCLYITSNQVPVTPVPEDPDFAGLTRHMGSLRGTWPTVSDVDS